MTVRRVYKEGELDRRLAGLAIAEAQTFFPTLTPNGFAESLEEAETVRPIDPEQVHLCIKWINDNMVLSTKPIINVRQNSYTLKHWVEEDYNTYVTNGAFICAAYHTCADVQIGRCTGNPMFNLFMRKRRK
jgi:hypothetical protein